MNTVNSKRRRHTPEQVVRKLAEGNRLQAGGEELDEVCRTLGITPSTWHRRVAQYGQLDLNQGVGIETEIAATQLASPAQWEPIWVPQGAHSCEHQRTGGLRS